jgi:hypothetical protein
MYTALVYHTNTPPKILKMERADGCAEYRLSQNVREQTDEEGNVSYVCEEVYFEAGEWEMHPTLSEVEAQFALYWEQEKAWGEPEPTIPERVETVETAQSGMEATQNDLVLMMAELIGGTAQ